MANHVFPNYRLRQWFEILFTAVVYYILARLSLVLQFQSSNATPVWLPSGFAFAVILLFGSHVAPGILTGAFFANFLVFMSNQAASLPSAALISFLIGTGNTLEALAGFYLLRKIIVYRDIGDLFSRVRNIFSFTLVAMLMCMVSSSIGASSVFFSEIIASGHYPLVWITWWLGDFSSVLLITPLLLLWIHDIRSSILISKNHKRTIEAIALYIIAILVSGIIFDDWFSPPNVFHWAYWIIPVLVWAAIRFGQRNTITIITLCSAIAIKGTMDRYGPFSVLSLNESLLTLQAFISIMVITKLSLNASINERRQTVAELRNTRSELETRVQKRTADLQKKNEELSSFAYVASHDLQEPLRKIQAFASRIRESETNVLSDTGSDYLKRMENAAARMQQLIDDLLSYSRATTEEKMFVRTDLNVILDEVKDDLREKINSTSADISSEKLPEIEAVPFQLKQLFTNIISNSIKFARPGITPQVKIRSTIKENLKLNGETVLPVKNYHLITIEDNGIGFDSQYNKQVFGIFKRLHGRSEYEGTGIGLSIVKKIVENHNGIITAHGEEGKGTVLSIYLPLHTDT